MSKTFIVKLLIVLAVILLLWISAWAVLLFSKYRLCWWTHSSFGDVFTSLSALFSGIAMVAIIFTLIYQTRVFQANQKENTINQFENNFFRLIGIQQQLLNNIQRTHLHAAYSKELNPNEVLEKDFQSLKKNYERMNMNEDNLERIKAAYEAMFKKRKTDLGHYFRHLYHIVKYIHISKIPNKQFYANLLRAQFSSYEYLLLFYNCLSEHGNKEFKPLVEKYALMEHMPDETLDVLLADGTNHKSHYKDSAFKEQIEAS